MTKVKKETKKKDEVVEKEVKEEKITRRRQ